MARILRANRKFVIHRKDAKGAEKTPEIEKMGSWKVGKLEIVETRQCLVSTIF